MASLETSSAYLVGRRLVLRPVERDDLPWIRKWTNDPEIRALTGQVEPMNEDAALRFLDRIENDPARIWFMIAVKETGALIGEAGLLRMFPPWRTTDLTLIIGEREEWSKGYGTETMQLLLEHAFGCLGYHRVSVGVVAFNERALRFYEKMGFQREGILRDGYYHDHHFWDFVMMSILEDEYRRAEKTHTP
ncbi:MAG: GNAT family N-acetyltransferase [Bradymonadales bacterium]|nr:GNAT family N-acetyltransferase [Bradymonadales bacterium]